MSRLWKDVTQYNELFPIALYSQKAILYVECKEAESRI